MDSIPNDLISEIFARLPAKSIARFHCLSKVWRAMFYRPYFTELFLTRSSACPRLLFAIQGKYAWRFFSLPQPHNPYKNSSSPVVATKMASSSCKGSSWGYASGLICFSQTLVTMKEDEDTVICNPITGQYAILPKVGKVDYSIRLLGFDPIGKQYKVLSIGFPFFDEMGDHYRILTLETGNMSWRKILSPVKHNVRSEGLCINGVLYYLASVVDDTSYMIVCFDVRSEKFKVIDTKCFYDWPTRLININYKGKFGLIDLKYDEAKEAYELCMWVLADVEKRKLSKYVYTFSVDKKIVKPYVYLTVIGVTATSEIVLSTYSIYKPFYVFFFNPERNTFQTVEIQGFGENYGKVKVFVDHVEDLNVNDAKLLKSSIYLHL